MSTTHPASENRQKLPDGDTRSPAILYFDGVCGLCNRTVDFVLNHDRQQAFVFAPLQGETARRQLTKGERESLASLVLTTEQGTFRRSAGVVRVLWMLGWPWNLLGSLLWLVPLPVRDVGYRLVSKYRYGLFGKKDTCRLPTDEERSRFLP